MRITRTLQAKLEQLLAHAGYTVRYEKGRFRNGFCLIEDRKIVVLNKFYPFESRVNSLMDLTLSLPIDRSVLEPEDLKLYAELEVFSQKTRGPRLFAAA